MTVPFMYNFPSLYNRRPTIFLSFFYLFIYLIIIIIFFSHSTPQVRLFFVQKRKPEIFGLKNVMERGIKKKKPSYVMG